MRASFQPMDLRTLLEAPSAPSIEISGLCEDSRRIKPGDAFVAICGDAFDGHDFAADAIDRGAACVLSERPLSSLAAPAVQVENLSLRRGALAARFHQQPSKAMTCIGVTGTNGKTTIAYQTAGLAASLGFRCGYLGTLGWGLPGALAPSRLTTESAITTQQRLACLNDLGCTLAALEVSSHALAQGRADGISFDYALFSNLTRDHLDYHEDLTAYGAAKRRLFEFPSLRGAIINADDPFGLELTQSLPHLDVITYGQRNADILWNCIEHHEAGVRGRLRTPWGDCQVVAPVCGDFGLANLAAAIGALAAAGHPLAAIAAAASDLPKVPGRMEFFRQPGQPCVVVDYAHTPDALAKALSALRRHCRGKLICLVGCGGGRDIGKRPLMARISEDLADQVWLTSDNPRCEDPAKIIKDMIAGLRCASSAIAEMDRATAITAAIANANANDLILVAGKGHEGHQEIGGRRTPFSDRGIVRKILGLKEERP